MKKIFLIVLAMFLMLCCTACATVHDILHLHTYNEEVTAATCTEDGYTTYTCSCGDTYVDNKVNAKGHNYAKKVTAATCTKKGYTTYTCSCGDSYVSNYVNPSHSYSNYRCTKCSAVDKTHAYEYLVSWVKQNYTSSNEKLYLVEQNIGDAECRLGYSKSDRILVAAIGGPNGALAQIVFNDYEFTYRNELSGCEAYGTIKNSTYVKNGSLSSFNYYGPSSLKTKYRDYTESMVGNIVSWLDLFISSNVPGIDIKDIGFKNC